MLTFIEDRTFFKHPGISLRALARAFLGLIRVKRRSGGSTITQQLVRTLFVHQQQKLIRRKVVEILLAIWFNGIFPKDEQLELYLASVRFERGVFGVIEAMRHFWGKIIPLPSPAESFFLIERVSNIHSDLLSDKIIQTIKSAMASRMLIGDDVRDLITLYRGAVALGKIKDGNGGIERISRIIQTV
jgi:penicillin-binding protein 1A